MRKKLLTFLTILAVAGSSYAACTPANAFCNATVTGTLQSDDCALPDDSYYDEWRFHGMAGQVITIDMVSSAFDNYLILVDPDGETVAEADDGSSGDDERITFTLHSTGTWTIIANTYDSRETGHYMLRIECGVGQPSTCTTGGRTLCLNNNRYRVTLSATDPTVRTEQGIAQSQTNLFGWFSLPGFTGDAGNPEVFVKVLVPADGVPWVFYSGLTNLAYSIMVHDTTTGITHRIYTKPAPPFGSSQSFGDFDIAGTGSLHCSNVTTISAQTAPGSCGKNSDELCLLDRFRVSMFARDNPTRTSNSGDGAPVPINSNFGFFSAPALSNDATNIEAFVKIVDGRSVNGKFWVFLGGLTDFELTITVTDSVTGQQRVYTKPAGSTCGWNDTSAF